MIRITVLLLLLAGAIAGCQTNQGAREYIPGKGWVPVKNSRSQVPQP